MNEKELTFSDLLNKTLLIGLTYYTADEVLIERKQFFGTVIKSDEEGISVKLENGEIFGLPPDLRSTYPAKQGSYRLRSTGVIVTDPDFMAAWNIYKPEK